MGGTVVAVGRKASTASAVLICRLLRGSRVGGTNTGTSVLDWPVGHGELSEVVSDHLWLDFDSGEGLAIVDSDDGSGHLGSNDHVPAVGLHAFGLLHRLAVLLGLPQPLEHGLVFPLNSAEECATWASTVQH